MNGTNGFIVLTPEGKRAAVDPIDFDVVRVRERLLPDMLHQKLRGKPYADFANGHPTSAIQEAYKIIDIEVANAAKITGTYGVNMMMQAFDHNTGPLTDKSENEPTRRALARLFAGAFGRFRNSSTHTQRVFPDLHEAIEELMLASRLLRFLDETGARDTRPVQSTGKYWSGRLKRRAERDACGGNSGVSGGNCSKNFNEINGLKWLRG